MRREVVVVSGIRTAIGKFGGSLKDTPPTELGALVVREVLACADLAGDQVGHVVFGNVIATEPKEDGTVTAANASGINDAAAAVLLMARETAENRGIKPLARLVSYAHTGVDPRYMGIGPVPATQIALQRAGLKTEDLDVIEANEAFAAQACAVTQELQLDPLKVNPNGSGISLGHPIGATGALITVKVLHELRRINRRFALVAMCIGGGQGIAAVFENNQAA
jgi:acetyl-CoA C-acetyltransferase